MMIEPQKQKVEVGNVQAPEQTFWQKTRVDITWRWGVLILLGLLLESAICR